MLLVYFLNDFEIVSVAPVITGIIFVIIIMMIIIILLMDCLNQMTMNLSQALITIHDALGVTQLYEVIIT
jgi:hypothetical protein